MATADRILAEVDRAADEIVQFHGGSRPDADGQPAG
jgi:hypothetical protein